MDFDLTREQQMVRNEVRKFAENEIAPVAGELDEKEKFSVKITKKMGEIGLFGMFVSDEFGGQGMDYISYIIAVEEIARVQPLGELPSWLRRVAPGSAVVRDPSLHLADDPVAAGVRADTVPEALDVPLVINDLYRLVDGLLPMV